VPLRPNGLTQVPAETSRVARAAFPTGCLAVRALDALGPPFTDEQFAERFWTSRYGGARRRLAAAKPGQARAERAVAVGRDGLVLPEAVDAPERAGAPCRRARRYRRCGRPGVQQSSLDGGQVRRRDQQAGPPPGSRMLLEPLYDPGARPGANRARNPPRRHGPPHPGVPAGPAPPGHARGHNPTPATADPDTVQAATLASAPAICCPRSSWSTRASLSVGRVLAADRGVELIGPLPPGTSCPAPATTTRVRPDPVHKSTTPAGHVACPTARSAGTGRVARSRDGLPAVRATFRQPDCHPLPRPGTLHPLAG
jgi:hypothetical protein